MPVLPQTIRGSLGPPLSPDSPAEIRRFGKESLSRVHLESKPRASAISRSTPPSRSPSSSSAILERWRERDVFHESIRRREGAAPFVFYEGPPTANGRPGSHHVLSRVFKDVFPRYRTMRGHLRAPQGRLGLPRAAGGARDREGARLHQQGRHRALRRGGVQRQVPRVGARATSTSGTRSPSGSASGSTPTTPTSRSTTTTSSRSGGRSSRSGTRACSTRATRSCPYCPRCGTALSSHEVALGYKDVVDPSVYVRFPVQGEDGRRRCSAGPPRRGRCCRTPRWRCDPDVTYVRAHAGRRAADPGRGAGRAGARRGARRSRSAMKGVGAARAPPTSRPFPYITDYGAQGPHGARGRLRDHRGRHRRRAHRARLRRGRLPARRGARADDPEPGARPTAPSTSASARSPAAYVQGGRPGHRRGAARVGPPVPRRASTSTPTRTAGAATRRSSTTPSRAGTCAPPTVSDELLADNESINWYPEHIKHGRFGNWLREQRGLGALARALLGHAAADLALRRRPRDVRGLARGDRASSAARCPTTCTALHRRRRPALRRLRRRHAPRARPDRRLVGLGLHAVRPVARAVRERGQVRGALPGRLHLRGARPDARLVLLAARDLDAAVRAESAYETVPLPRPDPRRRGPEDVEVEGQHGRPLGRARRPRRRRVPLVLLHLEAAVGRLPLLARDGRRESCASS